MNSAIWSILQKLLSYTIHIIFFVLIFLIGLVNYTIFIQLCCHYIINLPINFENIKYISFMNICWHIYIMKDHIGTHLTDRCGRVFYLFRWRISFSIFSNSHYQDIIWKEWKTEWLLVNFKMLNLASLSQTFTAKENMR